jgi:hypothetical protein
VSGGFDVSHCERDYLDRAACVTRNACSTQTLSSRKKIAELAFPLITRLIAIAIGAAKSLARRIRLTMEARL